MFRPKLLQPTVVTRHRSVMPKADMAARPRPKPGAWRRRISGSKPGEVPCSFVQTYFIGVLAVKVVLEGNTKLADQARTQVRMAAYSV